MTQAKKPSNTRWFGRKAADRAELDAVNAERAEAGLDPLDARSYWNRKRAQKAAATRGSRA